MTVTWDGISIDLSLPQLENASLPISASFDAD
jgi:hypothetical protein